MKTIQIVEIVIAILFTFMGGFGDAYTFVIRGGTFTTIQTGNLIKLSTNLANGQFMIMFLLPIIFFCLGSMLAILLSKFKYYRSFAIILLFIIYLVSGFCPKIEAFPPFFWAWKKPTYLRSTLLILFCYYLFF